MNKRVVVAIASIALFFFGTTAQGQKTYSGQSIMANIHNDTTISFVGTEKWGFDKEAAAEYFTDSLTSGPTEECSGNAANCAETNRPSPIPPEPDNGELMRTTRSNACAFLNGGELVGDTYEQSVTVPGLNGKGNWRFTFVYTVSPKGTEQYPNPVAAKTAWYLISSDTDSGDVDITGFIAGLSGVNTKQWNRKYSFSLLDAYGLNRVTDVVLAVSGSSGTAYYPVTTVLRSNAPGAQPGDPGAVDFNYLANGGSNGNLWVLPPATFPPGGGLDGRYILNTDSFAGNDDGGADGGALTVADFSIPGVLLDPGTNVLTLSGIVKGNGMTASITFTVTYEIEVIANCIREYPQ